MLTSLSPKFLLRTKKDRSRGHTLLPPGDELTGREMSGRPEGGGAWGHRLSICDWTTLFWGRRKSPSPLGTVTGEEIRTLEARLARPHEESGPRGSMHHSWAGDRRSSAF